MPKFSNCKEITEYMKKLENYSTAWGAVELPVIVLELLRA